jgi:hypothetical protein
MTLERFLRPLGALLAGALVTTLILTDYDQCGSGNGVKGWLLIVQPTSLALVFSLPRPGLGAYFKHGLAAVLGIAIAAGIYGSSAEPPRNCELLYGGSDGYFVFWGVWNFVVLAVGAVPVILVLLAIKDLPLLARRLSHRPPQS